MRLAIGFMTMLGCAATAAAQYPISPYGSVAPPGSFVPNYFNRQTQPLSPYLNLMRGNNPAANYYYNVRPGTPAGGMTPFGTPGFNQLGPTPGMQQGMFLPQASVVVDPGLGQPFEQGGRPTTLAPAGHPVMFGNVFNGHGSYFSVYAPTINRSGAGGAPGAGPRQGVGGLGTLPRR